MAKVFTYIAVVMSTRESGLATRDTVDALFSMFPEIVTTENMPTIVDMEW